MAKKWPSSREVLAHNLKVLIKRAGVSGPTVAVKAGVDRKTLNNYLNTRADPRVEVVQAVAQVFGYGAWDLLNPNFEQLGAASATKTEKAEPTIEWPFSISYEQYSALDDDEKNEIDETVAAELLKIKKRRERQRDKMPVKSARSSAKR